MQPKLKSGDRFYSPGMNYEYEVIGAVCLLYDREELPYPCCSLEYKGKQPSWNRQGKRFIPNITSKDCETYNVKLLNHKCRNIFTYSFSYYKINKEKRDWWITKLPKHKLLQLK